MARKIDTMVLPSPADQKVFREHAKSFWTKVLEGVNVFQMAMQDVDNAGDEKRKEIRETYTLGKPIVQMALVEATIRLQRPATDGSVLPMDEIIDRINATDWRVDNPLWQNVLMNRSKVVTGKASAKFAARFIAYLLGEGLMKKELEVLEKQYVEKFDSGSGVTSLPPRSYT